MSEYGIPIPEPYDDPANWPYRWCSYDDARGFVTRIRAEGSREGKAIAQERGVDPRTVSRAVAWFLKSTGQYDPETWKRYQQQRKAEARRWFLDTMSEHYAKVAQENVELAERRATLLGEREARERASQDLLDSAQRRKELQRKLNVRNRARWS
jgi:hypothetical protein